MSFIYTFAIKDLEYERAMAIFKDCDERIAYLRTRLKILKFVVNLMPYSRKKGDLIALGKRICTELCYSPTDLFLYPYDRTNPRPKLP
jgi:hypothetical protein